MVIYLVIYNMVNEMKLLDDEKQKINNALESGKLDIGLANDYREIIDADNPTHLNKAVDCFASYKRDNNINGIYTLHTTYKMLLEKIEDDTIYRLNKSETLKLL